MAEKKTDDFTDLTEDSSAGEEGKPKKKQGGPSKQPKPQVVVVPTAAPVGKEKKKKGGKLKIILIIIIVVLVAGFVAEEIIFNFLGVRSAFVGLVVKLDTEKAGEAALDELFEQRFSERFNEREDELNKLQGELDTLQRSLETRETQLLRRGIELDLREEALEEKEQQFVPRYRREMTEQELEDMQALGNTYSLMSPEAAASILMELENADDVAAILYFMSDRNAASILAAMDPEYAAVITEILLDNPISEKVEEIDEE